MSASSARSSSSRRLCRRLAALPWTADFSEKLFSEAKQLGGLAAAAAAAAAAPPLMLISRADGGSEASSAVSTSSNSSSRRRITSRCSAASPWFIASSSNSRRTVAETFSPGSTIPPGMAHVPVSLRRIATICSRPVCGW